MSCHILRADRANDQLNDIIQYIANDSGDVDLALHILDTFEAAIMRLTDFPASGSEPRYSILKRQGYRVLIVERYLVFYKVHESAKAVIVYAVVDGRRDYFSLI